MIKPLLEKIVTKFHQKKWQWNTKETSQRIYWNSSLLRRWNLPIKGKIRVVLITIMTKSLWQHFSPRERRCLFPKFHGLNKTMRLPQILTTQQNDMSHKCFLPSRLCLKISAMGPAKMVNSFSPFAPSILSQKGEKYSSTTFDYI